MNAIDIFPWDDNFNTGLPEVDDQHRKLVQLLNKLASHVAFRTEMSDIGAVFDELAAYTVYHFETEERIWDKFFTEDDEALTHHATHQRFIDKVAQLRLTTANMPAHQVADDALDFLAR